MFEFFDDRFRGFVLPNAALVKLGDGFAWLEGPVWFADQQCLLVSDLPANRVMRWTARLHELIGDPTTWRDFAWTGLSGIVVQTLSTLAVVRSAS